MTLRCHPVALAANSIHLCVSENYNKQHVFNSLNTSGLVHSSSWGVCNPTVELRFYSPQTATTLAAEAIDGGVRMYKSCRNYTLCCFQVNGAALQCMRLLCTGAGFKGWKQVVSRRHNTGISSAFLKPHGRLSESVMCIAADSVAHMVTFALQQNWSDIEAFGWFYLSPNASIHVNVIKQTTNASKF